MRKSTGLCFLLLLFCQFLAAQTVPFPTGNRDYEAISPWGYTNKGTSWNTAPYLPFIYRDMWFRLMPPNGVTYSTSTNTWNYGSDPTRKYPLLLFFHGAGEVGNDNNNQLKNGGLAHMNGVTSGKFPGYLLYPQNIDASKAGALIEKLIAQYPIDVNRIYVHGLSNGAKWSWDFAQMYPKLIAAFAACSGMSNSPEDPDLLYTPIRQAQGGLDTNPAPSWTQSEYNWFVSQGAQMEYFLFPNLGHGTWDTMYGRSDWFSWFLSQKKNKIYVRYNKYQFCPGSPVSATLGFTAGFDAYEWRKDGTLISGATTNAITVTSYGSYTGRIKNRGVWSDWSDPVVVGDKAPTQTPNIQLTTLQSKYIPDVNGNSSVGLTLPAGYESYTWNKSGVTAAIGTTQSVTVTSVGSYTATVRETGGCSSLPSPAFTIIDANGTSKPDAASNLQVTVVSKTALRLNWENTTAPSVDETGFEVYRGTTSGGPYTLIAVTAANVLLYNDVNLPQNSQFYYKVRAISATAAAAATAEATGVTDVDITPPTPPNNLAASSIGANNVNLTWSASTDDVAVTAYDVYVRQSGQTDYVKANTTTATSQNVFGLNAGTLYNFIVKARDAAGNVSNASAMVAAGIPANAGLSYSYYEGNWSAIPNFDALTPRSTGTINNFSLTPATAVDYFGMRFTGTLYMPVTGEYTFYLSSDDGSKLYVNNTLVINHDGLHGQTEKQGKITLNAGYYPIKAEYLEATGGAVLIVSWSAPGISKQTIPDANLREPYTMPTPPAAPTGVTATAVDYKSITVNWTAYTGTGTDIEIYRSPNGNSNWAIVATVPKTQNSYTNIGLNASTQYYYRLRAINSGNVSDYSSANGVSATTASLPPIPTAPASLAMSAIGANTLTLTWQDRSTNEDNFEVYKSTDNTTFSKAATVAANVVQYVDNGVFAHTRYYYKVLAKNVRGSSAYTNTVNGTTSNNAPVLSGLRDVTLRYDETVILNLTATDPDNDFLVIGGNSLPAYVQLFDQGDGTAVLEIEPTQADMGEHPGLQVFVKDAYNGIQTLTFKVTVNNNHNPVIAALAPLTVSESFIGRVTATATDGDNDALTWSFQNAPAFMSYVANGNSVDLRFTPGLSDAGTYNVTLKATDINGGIGTQVLQVTVQDYDPNFNVKVNFRTEATANGPTGWNNIGPAVSTTALIKENGTASGISLTLVNAWTGWRDGYGVKPGVYPDAVNGSYIYFYAGDGVHTLRLTGLNVDGKYNLKFLSSNSISDGANRTTRFTVNGQSQTIQANANASTLVTFSGLVPSAAGELSIAVEGPSGGYAVLNALVIESFFDGNAAPAAPTALAATISSGLIQLNWTDASVNEASFEVYRSTDNTNFTKLATLPINSTTYSDATFSYGITYYYKVRAVNGIGASPYSNVVNIIGPNHAPVIRPFTVPNVAESDTGMVLVQADDPDAGDVMDFTLENAPRFAWTDYVDNGQVQLSFAPDPGERGNYQFQIRCTDSHGGVATANVMVTITSNSETTISVNFTTTASMAAAPWNNITGYTAGTVLNNLVNANNTATNVSMTIQTAWVGTNPNGYTTGNNTGVYPDAVMSNSFYVQDNAVRNILMRGLNPSKLYDFTFFASRTGVTDVRETRFTIGSKSAVLNASNNTSNLAKVTAIQPNTSGQVTIAVTKESAAQYAYLNAMVIREYDGTVAPSTPLPPTNLVSQVITKTSARLIWQDASDNETGFEVWRSVGNNTSYALLTTLAANTTSYTNTGLAASTTYYYKVRAANAAGVSVYSNESSATTYDYSISVNFDAFNTGPANWNNLSAFLSTGAVVTGLKDENNVNTGVSMTVVAQFAGDNPYGMNTGNNSGIVPDRVMEGSWWIDRTQVATLKFNNLSFLKKYNFSFFGSRNADGDRNTVYMIGSQSVTLNASLNTSNIVQIKGVVPDADGSVTVNITTTSTAQYGYLNGLIIQAIPGSTGGAGGNVTQADEAGAGMRAYPNPFTDRVLVNVGNDQSSKFHISLVNASGIVVHEEHLDRSPTREELEVILREDLSQGIYMLRVKGNAGSVQGLRLFRK